MKNHLFIFICVFFLLKMFNYEIKAQTFIYPSFQVEIKNDTQLSPNVYQFDVYVKSNSFSFEQMGFQAGFFVNSAILNGGYLKPTIVSGFSDLVPAARQTTSNLSIQGSGLSYGIKMTGTSVSGKGNGTQINSSEKRICRIRVTNQTSATNTIAVPFAVNSHVDLSWCFGSSPWQTKLNAYVNSLDANGDTIKVYDENIEDSVKLWTLKEISIGNSNSFITTNRINPLLNTPPVKYNVTGTASYCQGSGANIGLDNSELGVRYQLYKDNVALGTPIIGTGSALTWTNNTFGNYIVIASRIATAYSDTMNNTAVLTEAVGLPGSAGSITGNATICQGNPGETYTVPVITNTENYVWEYSGTGVTINGTTNTAVVNFSSNATSGNLTVKGQNACGLGTISTPLAIVLSNLPDPAGVITGVSTVSPGQTAVAYSVPVINGATTYTWIYSGLGATINGNSNAITIDFGANATPGFLTVKGTNPCGNGIVSADFAVNVNSIPGAAGTIMGVASVCPGQNNVIFTVPAILGADTYLWEYSGTGVTIDSILGDTAYINFAMNATSGNLTVKGHNTFGYGGVSSNFAITVNSFPDAAGLISGLDTVCKNTNNIVFSVPAILYATNYVWTLPTGATGTSTTNSISVNFGATAINGNITVKGTNVCGDGVLSTKAVVINTVPSGAGTISGLSPVCQGTNNLTYTVPSISGATSYIWTLPAGVTGTSTTNSIIANVSLTSTGGQITVKGSNACGNGTASAMSLTVNPLPSAAGVITGLNTVCQGQSGVTYSVPSITNATSYIWTKPNFATGSSTTNTITLAYPTNAVSGDVTVKGNNACGQGAVSTRSIVVNPLPDTAQAITGLATVCKGITGVVYKVPTINNATSYAWTLPTGVLGTSSVDSIIVDFSSTAVSGNITVKGVNACGDGISTSFAITVNDVPAQAGTIAGNASVCQGQNGITYTIPVISGASSYIWTIPSGFTGTSTTNSILVNIAANANSGNITVKGSNTCGEGLSSILPVTVNSTPDTAGVIAGAITVCQGQTSVTYTVPAINNATSYQWTLPAGASGSSTTNSITLNYASFAVSGNLKVKGQNACGFGQESLLAITVNPLPSNGGTIIGNALVCKGQTLTYKVPAINNANSYVWTYPSGFTGSSTVDSIVLVVGASAVSGTITVKGQNACGVSSVASSKTVTVNSVPAAPGTITGNSNVCQGAQNETYSISAVSGATSYSWNLPSGATGSSTSTNILVNFGSTASSGNIVVKASNVCGTGDSTFKMITVNSIPVAAGTISGSTTVCQGATGQVYSIPAITGATSYIWTLPAGVTGTSTTNTITVSFANNTAAGSISVYGSNACGDGSPSSIAFTITALPGAAGTITSVGGDSIVAAGTKTYTVPAITGATSYIWTYTGTGATITGTTNTVSISFLSNFTNGSLTVMGQNACGNGTVSAGYFITNYVGINDPDGNSLNYSIYPNPTKGIITVNINGINSNLELQITNLQGEIIRTENLTNNKQSYSADIDLSAYAKGIYFVKFINNKFVKVEKIVLQ